MMARARNIKPAFFTNEDLAEVVPEARLLFIGLWTLADREGRLEDRPKRIKGEIFPYDNFDCDVLLAALAERNLITRYSVNGCKYLLVNNFVKHQNPHPKEKESELPGLPCNYMASSGKAGTSPADTSESPFPLPPSLSPKESTTACASEIDQKSKKIELQPKQNQEHPSQAATPHATRAPSPSNDTPDAATHRNASNGEFGDCPQPATPARSAPLVAYPPELAGFTFKQFFEAEWIPAQTAKSAKGFPPSLQQIQAVLEHYRTVGELTAVSMLRKCIANGWPAIGPKDAFGKPIDQSNGDGMKPSGKAKLTEAERLQRLEANISKRKAATNERERI
jgi:hypothetical protein